MIKRLCITTLLCVAMALPGCGGTSSGSNEATPSGDATASTQASASTPAGEPLLADRPIMRDDDFGSIIIGVSPEEFNDLGFAYGDGVNVRFSNGFELTVPYFNGYYGKVGDKMLVAYPGNDVVLLAENFGDQMWNNAGVSEDDTVTISLAEAGAFLDVQEAFNVTYSDERSDYESDVIFANFRSLAGGDIAPDLVYRSASPVDDEHNRAAYVEKLMAEAKVGFVLDLSDDDAEIDEFEAEAAEKNVDTSYFEGLRKAGNVVGINLGANYPSPSFAEKLSDGLVALSEHDGPYLLHCIEGKDRTGFVCMLLEALTGASYDEMLADYMTTFDNYYGISEQSDPARYNTIASTNFDGMLEHLPGLEDSDVKTADYVEPARAYLRAGGMTDKQIDALVARITAKG